MPIVPVKLVANDSEIIKYAMLDSCCTGTFVLEDVLRELQEDGTGVILSTMNGSINQANQRSIKLKLLQDWWLRI